MARAWGRLDAVAAVAWGIQQESDAAVAVEAALVAAAAQRPPLAVDLSRCLLTLDPEAHSRQAGVLLDALLQAHDFGEAARLATGVPFASAAPLTSRAFAGWAEHAPEAALRAVDQLASARLRRIAFAAIINGWARGDPAALANHAAAAFDDDARQLALREAASRHQQ